MKYLLEEECRENCDFHQVCIKYGKLYRDGCVLDGEGFKEGLAENSEERETRINRLRMKLADL